MILLQNVWWLLVLIGIMILIHELGHYWAGRFFDVRVETFSIGFGPRLFGFRKGETDFRFSAILFGGYVKFAGDQPGEDESDPRALSAKPRWQRLIVAFAGPAMNIVLAVVVLTGLFMFHYPKVATADQPATIGYIEEGSPAARAGLLEGDRIIQFGDIRNPVWQDVVLKEIASAQMALPVAVERNGQRINTTVTPVVDPKTMVGSVGWYEQHEVQVGRVMAGMGAEKAGLQSDDIIVAVNGQPIRTSYRLNEIIGESKGDPVEVTYSRKNQQNTVTVHPSYSTIDGTGRWMIGVELSPRVIYTQLSFPEALRESLDQNIKSASLILQVLQGMVERRMSPKSLEGPIGIAQISGEAAREGAGAFFALMAAVSLNLAIFNLLPIPILDGGLILLLLIEMVMRRDLSLTVKETVFKLGMVFLMVVVVFVLYNDISKILPG